MWQPSFLRFYNQSPNYSYYVYYSDAKEMIKNLLDSGMDFHLQARHRGLTECSDSGCCPDLGPLGIPQGSSFASQL